VMLICVNSSDDADMNPLACYAVSLWMAAIPGIFNKINQMYVFGEAQLLHMYPNLILLLMLR
jgi:hypothetical protein